MRRPRSHSLFAVAAACSIWRVEATSIATTKIRKTACFLGCTDVLKTVHFTDVDPTRDHWARYGSSDMFLTSLAACGRAYCEEEAVRLGWEEFRDAVERYGRVDVESYDYWSARIPEGSLTEVDVSAIPAGKNFKRPVLIDRQSWYYGMRTEATFGWSMYLFVLACGLVGVLNRLFATWARRRPPPGHTTTSVQSRLRMLYKKHLSVPAFYGYKHNQSGWGYVQIPTRLAGLLIGVYVGINTVMTVMPYHLFKENYYWPNDTSTQLMRYLADRTGIMAFYNLPLLFVLGGRNDVFLWICGWSFPDAMLLHRWVARVATTQAIVHSLAYIWQVRGQIAESFSELYWLAGAVATAAMMLTIVVSLKPIRDKAYEVFLIGHIALSFITLGALYYHVNVFDGLYNGWLWACVAIWLFDRFARVVRVMVLSLGAVNGDANAEAVLAKDSAEMIRLTVRTTSLWKYPPGCYFFIYFPSQRNFWESHPFTLGSVETDEKGSKLNFLIAPQSGSTKKLARQIGIVGGRLPIRAVLEGPYGHTAPVEQFEKILMVAGGSGITPMISYLQRLQRLALNEVSVTRAVHIVWIVRNRMYAHSVMDVELDQVTKGLSVILHVYVTAGDEIAVEETPLLRAHSCPGSYEACEEAKRLPSASDQQDYQHNQAPWSSSRKIAQWRDGRPSMQTLLDEALADREVEERLAVMTCGPARLMDDMRGSIVAKYDCSRGISGLGEALEYFEEGYGW